MDETTQSQPSTEQQAVEVQVEPAAKPPQDPYITKLESRYRNLQIRRDRARANGWTNIEKEIEAKMDAVSEKTVRALLRRRKTV